MTPQQLAELVRHGAAVAAATRLQHVLDRVNPYWTVEPVLEANDEHGAEAEFTADGHSLIITVDPNGDTVMWGTDPDGQETFGPFSVDGRTAFTVHIAEKTRDYLTAIASHNAGAVTPEPASSVIEEKAHSQMLMNSPSRMHIAAFIVLAIVALVGALTLAIYFLGPTVVSGEIRTDYGISVTRSQVDRLLTVRTFTVTHGGHTDKVTIDQSDNLHVTEDGKTVAPTH